MKQQCMEAQPSQAVPEPFLRYPHSGYLLLRQDAIVACYGDILAAAVLRVVEYSIELARRGWQKMSRRAAEPEFWISLSYRDFRQRIYYCAVNEKTIIAKLAFLENLGFLRRRVDPGNPYGSPQYTINRRALQQSLDALSLLDLEAAPDPVRSADTPLQISGGDGVPADGTGGASRWYTIRK